MLRRIDAQPLFGPKELSLAQWLSGMYLCALGEALAAMLPGGRREVEGEELAEEPEAGTEITLSADQAQAVERLSEAREGMFYLLRGHRLGQDRGLPARGSGGAGRGRGVIYLVPEIALTHQVVEIFAQRFGSGIAVLHSGLSALAPAGRVEPRARRRRPTSPSGPAARSSPPCPGLGLVVIDEEHEGSYKSGTTPRYHARQVAMHRAARRRARSWSWAAPPLPWRPGTPSGRVAFACLSLGRPA